jgi:hypothetical protein
MRLPFRTPPAVQRLAQQITNHTFHSEDSLKLKLGLALAFPRERLLEKTGTQHLLCSGPVQCHV